MVTRPSIFTTIAVIVAALAGCSAPSDSCQTDADCAPGHGCAKTGGVFYRSGVCVPTSPTDTRDGGADANDFGPDACPPETDEQFCDRLNKDCGEVQGQDNCERKRTVFCGDCVSSADCVDNLCVCGDQVPVDQFCTANERECGPLTALDECGLTRTVECGDCPDGETCGEAGACVDTTDECAAGIDTCTEIETCVDRENGFDCIPPRDGNMGDACDSDSDCPTQCMRGLRFHEGMCAPHCRDDGTCPEGARCISTLEHGSVCFPTCESGDDCRSIGYACVELSQETRVCVPVGTGDGGVDDECESLADCSGGATARCIQTDREGTRGFCTRRCNAEVGDPDCPPGLECADGPAYDDDRGARVRLPICLSTCETDDECSVGYTCFDTTADGRGECRPAIGKGYTETCNSWWECIGDVNSRCEPLYDDTQNPLTRHCTAACGITSACDATADCIDGVCRLTCGADGEDCPEPGVCDSGHCYPPP